MLYLDTSVLLVYTLARSSEPHRFRTVQRLFGRISEGAASAATSFYALHEVALFALDNAPDSESGYAYGRAALSEILALPIRIVPLLSRADRRQHGRRFESLIRDPSDVPHAICCFLAGCDVLLAYDDHFRPLVNNPRYLTPEAFLAMYD